MTDSPLGLTARIVDRFLTSQLSIILLLAALVGGGIALLVTPREEDPQIVVPMADVLIEMPGASAAEVENLVTINLEKKLWAIDGVEHVYSISRPGFALVTVRFYVGEDRTASLVKIYNKIQSNLDAVPSGVTGWVVKPVEISDVPILNLTLYSATATDADLRRVGDEILNRLQEVPNTAVSTVVGGRRRQIRVQLDAERMAAHGVAPLDILRVLRGADANLRAGEFARENREFVVDSGPFIASAQDLGNVVLAAPAGKPVSVRDVAEVIDGLEETTTYTRLRFGPAAGHLRDAAADVSGKSFPAVTLAFAKRRGTNAVNVAEGLLRQIEELIDCCINNRKVAVTMLAWGHETTWEPGGVGEAAAAGGRAPAKRADPVGGGTA
ncbi:MAG TPA: efflux RND transporter permease subunit, partial [Candidatus Acidoferrales bacterium]|nr:efflux RND transporter permease subunit [Candidatus Acidoferrales bacterium]